MNFIILRENANKALAIVQKAVNARSPLPILGNVLISAEKGRITFTTSNLNMTISVAVGGKVDVEGAITVPAKLFFDFVSQLTDEKFEATLDGTTVRVASQKVKAEFHGVPASEFPKLEPLEKPFSVTLPSAVLSEALQKIQYVVASDESRPVLTGVYMKLAKNVLTLAGTDGFRMAECTLKLPVTVEKEMKCVIPAKALADIVKSFSVESETLDVAIDETRNSVVVKTDDMEAFIRMIEGQYPDYAAIVPADHASEITVEKDEFSSAVKLANVFAKDLGNMVKIVAKSDGVTVLSQPTESGSNAITMNAKLDGDELEIAFNARYLLEFLQNTENATIHFQATESTKPGMFRIKGKDNYFYLVMPMKANW